MKFIENHSQMAVVQYLRMKKVLFVGGMAGLKMSMSRAIRRKALGYEKGCPDLCIFEPRNSYHGLFVEMKTAKGSTTPHQKAYLKALQDRKYRTEVVKSAQEAIDVIDSYLKS